MLIVNNNLYVITWSCNFDIIFCFKSNLYLSFNLLVLLILQNYCLFYFIMSSLPANQAIVRVMVVAWVKKVTLTLRSHVYLKFL